MVSTIVGMLYSPIAPPMPSANAIRLWRAMPATKPTKIMPPAIILPSVPCAQPFKVVQTLLNSVPPVPANDGSAMSKPSSRTLAAIMWRWASACVIVFVMACVNDEPMVWVCG